jgi:hypothetical protein
MGYIGAVPAAQALTSADITDGIIINADVKADAAIALSKTALVAGTGITLATNTLNVDASQGHVTTVGALNAGSITSGFTSINVGAGAITTTGAISGGTIDASTDFTIGGTVITDNTITDDGTLVIAASTATSFSDGNITNVGNIALDTISADATDISIAVTDNSATALTVLQGSDAYLIVDTANGSESVSIGTGISGTAIAIGHGTSEVTFGDNVTITGDLTINGTTTTVASTTLTVADPLVKYGQAYVGSAYDQGFIVTRGNGSASNTQNMGFIWDESADEFATIKAATEDGATAGNVTVTDYVNLHVGAITADDTSVFSGSIELGHASDTTIARSGAGALTVEGTAVLLAGDALTGTTIDATTDFTIGDTVITNGVITDTSGLSVVSATTVTGALTVGVDDTGHDVKFFGASAGAYMEYDQSADQLRIMGASADAVTSTGKLLLATSLTAINANDVIGKIDFQAPHEAGGTDAITVAASIQAIAQGTFAADLNATDMIFYTGHSEAATEKFRITSQGELGIGGATYGSSGDVLTSGGAGAAPTWATPTVGDITSVVAGAGMTGGATTGAATVNVIGGDGITANANDVAITAAQTTITSVYNTSLKFGRDSQNLIDFATTDNKIILRVNNVDEVELVENALSPVTNDGVALGTTSLGWSDLHIASAGVINWVNGEMTITETNANLLTVAGGNLAGTFVGDITGDVTGTADVATVATTVTITDNESTDESNAIIFTAGGDVDGGNIGLESDGTLTYNPSTGKITATGFVGALTGAVTGNVTGTADVATVATTVTITDNESTDEDNAIIFTAGGDVDGGNLGLESDGTLNYNPSTGLLTSTGFAGALTGNVTGNASGTAATVTTGTQASITTLANVTTVGALGAGTIAAGFGAIDNGTSGIRTNTFTAETSIVPDAASGATLGTTSLEWGHIYIGDDQKIYLGDGQDVSLEYDEDGTDQLRIAGDTIFENNVNLADAANLNIGVPLLAGTDHTTTGMTAQMLAGGAIAAFDLVCIHTTTQEVVEADASAAATSRVIGIAPAAISDTATGTVLLQGFVRDDTWAWTTGGALYLSETAGAMTHTAPTTDGAFVQVVGVALSPDVVYINPSMDVIEHA